MRNCIGCKKKLDNRNNNCDVCGAWMHCFCGKAIESKENIPVIVRCFQCAKTTI